MDLDFTVEDIGKKIKELRILKSIKLVELASKAGVSKGLISKIENQKTIPSIPVLFKIIVALEIQLNSFFTLSDSILPEKAKKIKALNS